MGEREPNLAPNVMGQSMERTLCNHISSSHHCSFDKIADLTYDWLADGRQFGSRD
jgi:hypothetical protein